MEPNRFRKFTESKMAELGEKPGKIAATNAFCEGLKQKKFSHADVSFRELYEALVGQVRRHSGDLVVMESAIDTSFFQHAAGVYITLRLMETYNAIPRIGRDLVTVQQTSKTRNRIPGIVGIDALKDVPESGVYPDATIFDRWVDGSVGSKRGRILRLTMEAIADDDTGMIMRMAADMGQAAAEDEEQYILAGIVNPSYYPKSVSTAFYATSGSIINDKTGNALGNYANVETLMKLATAIKDENNRGILVDFPVMLVPFGLLMTANSIVNATQVTRAATLTPPDAKIQMTGPNPLPVIKVYSSMLLDNITPPTGGGAAASNWYMGNSKKAFTLLEKLPLGVFSQGASSDDAFNRDIDFSFKVRRQATLIATDPRYFFRSRA